MFRYCFCSLSISRSIRRHACWYRF